MKIIKDISNENGYFYMNGMFAGFGKIDNIPVTKGKTIIHTGTNFTADAAITPRKKNKDYYILVDIYGSYEVRYTAIDSLGKENSSFSIQGLSLL